MTRGSLMSLFLAAGLAVSTASAQTAIAPEKVAEGIWATPTPGGANVGWFLLGDSVVAVDSGSSDEVGRALVEQIQKTTGKKPRYLVITHAHRDHAGGAAAFAAAGAQIVAAEKSAPGVLFVLEAAARGAHGAKTASSTKSADTPIVMTVAERSLLLGAEKRRAEIYYLGPGHTQGDLVLVLPADGVLFPGDLAVNGVLPYMRSADVDPKGWDRILARLSALKIDRMVPGHGKIGPREGIAETAAYIRRVNEIAVKFVLSNVPESMYEMELRAPENAVERVALTPEHLANVKAVCQFERANREQAPAAPAPAATPRSQ